MGSYLTVTKGVKAAAERRAAREARKAVTGVYDEAGNVIETHEHAGDFKE